MNFDEEYRGFSPYATFETWKKVALAKNRISHVCTQKQNKQPIKSH